MKKTFLSGALALAAVSLLAVAPNTARADGTTPEPAISWAGNVTFNYEEQYMTIKAPEVLQVSVATVAKKDDFSKAKWEIYDTLNNTDGVKVDLSKLNKSQDNYIQIKTVSGYSEAEQATKETAIKRKITAVAAASSAKLAYDKKTGSITINKNAVKASDMLNFEYKVSTASEWKDVTEGEGNDAVLVLDLSAYQRNGATLYFRQKATENDEVTTGGDEEEASLSTQADDPVYKFTGVEQKVTISAISNCPKITLDYNNHKANIPAGVEYRIAIKEEPAWYAADGTPIIEKETSEDEDTDTSALADGDDEALEYVEASSSKESVLLCDAILVKGGFIETRKAQTATALATKVLHTELPKIGTLEPSASASPMPGTLVQGTDENGDSATGKVVGDYTYDITKSNVDGVVVDFDKDKGTITFKNSSAEAYEYVIVPRYSIVEGNIVQEVPEGGITITGKIAKNKPNGVACKVKFTEKDYIGGKNEKVVYIRKVANTKTKSWSTAWALCGGVVNPKPATTPSPAPSEDAGN